MTKRLFSVLLCLFCLFSMTACFETSKEFSGTGITLTLTSAFVQKEMDQFPFYLESFQTIFAGMRENQADCAEYDIYSLRDYMDAVLDASDITATVHVYEEAEPVFMYAYYTKTIDEVEYGYMAIVMEGASYFYAMTFGCLEEDLEGNKAQYLEWTKTIRVD